MATLDQNSDNFTIYTGWYGTCDTECNPYDLTQPQIIFAYHVHSSNVRYDSFDSRLPPAFNQFTEMKCGNAYIVILKPGTSSITIPHFTPSNTSTGDVGRIINQCAPSMTPTPTVTVTPTVTPTITPTPTPTRPEGVPPPSLSVTPTPTPTSAGACEGFQYTLPGNSTVAVGGVRVQGIPATATVCHHGATGGAPSDTILKPADKAQPVGVLVINGALTNGDIKYIHTDQTIYTGTVVIGQTLTILNRV